MANSKSARKRAAKSEAQREKNRAARSKVRTAVKHARQAMESSNDPRAVLATAISTLDASTSKGLIHRNAAARTKSRLAKAAKKAKAGS
jgi:small subunit ribosomal protein S20